MRSSIVTGSGDPRRRTPAAPIRVTVVPSIRHATSPGTRCFATIVRSRADSSRGGVADVSAGAGDSAGRIAGDVNASGGETGGDAGGGSDAIPAAAVPAVVDGAGGAAHATTITAMGAASGAPMRAGTIHRDYPRDRSLSWTR